MTNPETPATEPCPTVWDAIPVGPAGTSNWQRPPVSTAQVEEAFAAFLSTTRREEPIESALAVEQTDVG